MISDQLIDPFKIWNETLTPHWISRYEYNAQIGPNSSAVGNKDCFYLFLWLDKEGSKDRLSTYSDEDKC